ncbi:MAG: aspartate aminotransferase family protein [Ruminococcaceae bacterium]|nr:aspartate aminotransferase family protein [Oscillospiraceae bacterium]
MKDIFSIDNEYVAHTYGRFPVALVKGKGADIWDTEGKKYIDLGSGIAVNIFGIADDEWQAAVTEQLGKLQHTSNLYYTEPCAKLAELLCKRTSMKKVFYGNSGAEANECAIKAARLYSYNKYGEGRSTIITLKNSFHGRTITTLSATGQDVFHTKFGPFTEGFVYCEADNTEQLRQLVEENNCCAIMFEVVQGEGGVHVLSKEFVAEIAKLAKEKDLITIVDEVQTGNGRTGKLYGYMNYDIQPDVVTTAKGLGGGLPIGVCMLGEKMKDVFTPGTHGSTFGGNPVCCAGAYSILSRIDEKLMSEVAEKSAYIRSELEDATGVESVSGMGLMLGIETQRPAGDIIKDAMEQGVLVLSAKTKVRLLPPLNISMEDLKTAIAILKEVIAR